MTPYRNISLASRSAWGSFEEAWHYSFTNEAIKCSAVPRVLLIVGLRHDDGNGASAISLLDA